MRCEEFIAILPSVPDTNMAPKEESEFRTHAAGCTECAAKLVEHEQLLASLRSLDDTITLPDAFSEGWRASIRNEAATPRRAKARNRWGWVIAAAAVMLVFSGTALMRSGQLFPSLSLDAQNTTYNASPQSAPYAAKVAPNVAEPMMEAADDLSMQEQEPAMYNNIASDTLSQRSASTPESIVLHTASVSLSTAQYDMDVARIDELLAIAGGWSEYWSVTGEPLATNPDAGRYATMTLRIPMGVLDSFIAQISAIGKVTMREKMAEDISDTYFDVQGRLSMYEAQRDRLTELLAQASSMSDIMDIESRLSEAQYTIETLVGRLNHWNSRADNGVVHLSVTEVKNLEDKAKEGFLAVIGEAFPRAFMAAGRFLSDTVVFLVMSLPYLMIAAGIGLIIFLIAKGRKKHKTDQRSNGE